MFDDRCGNGMLAFLFFIFVFEPVDLNRVAFHIDPMGSV
jgi:hypothetical protein